MRQQEIPQYTSRHEIPLESFWDLDKRDLVERMFIRQLPLDRDWVWGFDRKRGVAYIHSIPAYHYDVPLSR